MNAVIGMVSESLKRLLEGEMNYPNPKVTLLSPAGESSHTSRVNLFAYRMAPNAFLANRDFQPVPGSPDRVGVPPLSLSIFYLMTAYTEADADTGDADAQDLLAEAMRVLWEHAVIPKDYLEPGLVPGTLRATLQLVDPDEVSRVWTALSRPYELCAIYEVATLGLASVAERPVAPRVGRTTLTMRTGQRRPQVTAMSPRSGPVGTTVRFVGEDLAGWIATVTVGGLDASPAGPIEGDGAFTAEVPAGLAAGRYQVEVDVGGLASFRSGFEVTP